MPFLISTETLADAWSSAQNIARQIRLGAQSQKDASLVASVAGSRILGFERELRSFRDRLDVLAAIPGLAAYVGSLANTPVGYNVANEFSAMRAQIVATIDWIRNNFPKDATTSTYLLERSWAAEGLTERTFTTAQLAGYRTQLDALISAVG